MTFALSWFIKVFVAGAVLVGAITSAAPAHAGTDEFLNDLNNVGIGNHDNPHNFDLVGFGNAICWRLYEGQAQGQVVELVFTESQTGRQTSLTHDQAAAAVHFANADLCPDAAPH